MKQLVPLAKIALMASVAFEAWYMYALRNTPYKIAGAKGLSLEDLRGPNFRLFAGVAFFTIIVSAIIVLMGRSAIAPTSGNTQSNNPIVAPRQDFSRQLAKVTLIIIGLLLAWAMISVLFGILSGHFWDGYQF